MIPLTLRLNELLNLTHKADAAIMAIYTSDSFTVQQKSDDSPLTEADLASHRIICDGLKNLYPDVPVVSEENDESENQLLVREKTFWLVDPLDGTKDFISKSGEFTVCIALIHERKPIFGIVSAPALGVTYYGGPDMGSFKVTGGDSPVEIHVSERPTGIVLGSRSFREQETDNYLAAHFSGKTIAQIGSQLKFTRIAEGAADAYPRLGTTMHVWDLAAGHAILEGAGGVMTRPDGEPIDYASPTLVAGDFVARSRDTMES